MPLLSVEHASKRFGAVAALDDVSLNGGPRRIFRAAGPVRLRQNHVDAARRRLRDAGFRARDARRARSRRRAAASAARQYDVPVLRLVSASECFRQYRLRPAAPGREPRRDPVARRRNCSTSCRCKTSARDELSSFPAAKGSASRSPARWRRGRRCCCSTSRSPRSTASCARRRSSSSRTFSGA